MAEINQQFKKPIDWGKYFIYLCLILIGCLIMSLFKCNSDGYILEPTEGIKQSIQKDLIKKDSVKKEIIKQDSIRIEYVTKWRKLKGDTIFVPCDTLLKKVITLCDTIIIKDSIEIASLKAEIVLSDTIIGKYKRVVKSDSITIISLNKQVKKERRKKKLFILTTITALGLCIIK